MIELDLVIPVYNEGAGIGDVLGSFVREVKTPIRVLICYDRDDDDTLPAARKFLETNQLAVEFVKNRGKGGLGAVLSGFAFSTAPHVMTYMADDDFNAAIIDPMVKRAVLGDDVVAASRFAAGGSMKGAPWLKGTLARVASFTLRHVARLPVHDATNGMRLFSRRVLEQIPLESSAGFTYSMEWLVKAHRLGWPISEVPCSWLERTAGKSRFQVMKWLPHYLRWYFYAFATTYLRATYRPEGKRVADMFSTQLTNPSDG